MTPAYEWVSYATGMRDWIVANVDTYNIQLVCGLGDIVDVYGDTASWVNADTALSPLFDLDLPVLLFAAGNHDNETQSQTTRSLTTYNATFPTTLYSGKDWYGGVYAVGQAQNMYALFTVGNSDYLAFSLEFYPRDAVLDWVVTTAAAHPHRRVIICTHAYLFMDGTRDTWETDPYGAADYFTEGVHDANPGDSMWDWFEQIPRLFGVFGGHQISYNVAYDTDEGTAGNPVLQGFYNWQEAGQGGRGRVVLLTVDDVAGSVQQRVVRTDTDAFETGTSNGFSYATTHPGILPQPRRRYS